MKSLIVIAAVVVLAAACAPALAGGIEDLDAVWVKAVKAGNIEGIVALYDAEAAFYGPDIMEAKGKDAIRKVYEQMLGSMRVRDFVFLEANYETRGTLSVGWGRWVLTGEMKDGAKPVRIEGRFSAVAEKKDGKWLYVSDHASVPLPPAPGQETAPSEP
jgi:ketosteroid isomerase-like protein